MDWPVFARTGGDDSRHRPQGGRSTRRRLCDPNVQVTMKSCELVGRGRIGPPVVALPASFIEQESFDRSPRRNRRSPRGKMPGSWRRPASADRPSPSRPGRDDGCLWFAKRTTVDIGRSPRRRGRLRRPQPPRTVSRRPIRRPIAALLMVHASAPPSFVAARRAAGHGAFESPACTNSSKQTSELTGLPGRPNTSVVRPSPRVVQPNHSGLPGFRFTLWKTCSTPELRESWGHEVQHAGRDAAPRSPARRAFRPASTCLAPDRPDRRGRMPSSARRAARLASRASQQSVPLLLRIWPGPGIASQARPAHCRWRGRRRLAARRSRRPRPARLRPRGRFRIGRSSFPGCSTAWPRGTIAAARRMMFGRGFTPVARFARVSPAIRSARP